MSPTHVLGWRLACSEHAGAWQALLARIAPPDVVVTDGGAGFAKVCHAQWSDTRIQRCLFHISANVRSRTTRNPMIQGWSRTLRFITTTYPYYQ
ncbi:transposase [Alloscardovia omnicolens]|uniref:transposase n=2 Tax=Alloscardovia omnicolens TaxID=419015 RepID=UPI0012BC5274